MDHKSESICAIIDRFDRFITSEGTDALSLAFTSKTGQSVARYTHRFYYLDFSVRERIYLRIL